MGTADPDHLLTRLPRDVQGDWAALDRAGPERSDDPTTAFDPAMTDQLPDPVRRWLLQAIRPGAPLSTPVRMHQHGRINIRGWRTFRAQQVISHGGIDGGGYLWACSTRFFGLPVQGYDRLVSGRGDMVYRLLDRLTVVDESGPDLVRSAVGRLLSELCWVPAAALGAGIRWTGVDDRTAEAGLRYGDETFRGPVRRRRIGPPADGKHAPLGQRRRKAVHLARVRRRRP